jgi:phosphoglycolate phosphatase
MNQPLAVFFDFDGTLADSAPDLAGAANAMRVARGMEPLPVASLRPHVSSGARGMVQAAFGTFPGDTGFETLKAEFLERYEARLTAETALFDDIEPLLEAVEARGLLWGVVTNKAQRYTLPLVRHLGLQARCAAVVSGDTTPHAKPHPAPLLKAAELAEVAPRRCWYVGDDRRDIEAARAAGMGAIAAAWGYCGDSHPGAWQADVIAASPLDLIALLDRHLAG